MDILARGCYRNLMAARQFRLGSHVHPFAPNSLAFTSFATQSPLSSGKSWPALGCGAKSLALAHASPCEMRGSTMGGRRRRLCQGAFARPAGAIQQHHMCVAQGGLKMLIKESPIGGLILATEWRICMIGLSAITGRDGDRLAVRAIGGAWHRDRSPNQFMLSSRDDEGHGSRDSGLTQASHPLSRPPGRTARRAVLQRIGRP
jgi:hypothetical protein